MKCIVCCCSNTEDNPVTKAPDPFQSEINDDDTEVWECRQCRDDSEMEIQAKEEEEMNGMYILEGKEVKPIEDVIEWGSWFGKADCKVASTELPNGVRISTAFLGLDHSFGGSVPILFETMIFDGKHDQYQERYATWDEAEVGHKQAVKLAQEVKNE